MATNSTDSAVVCILDDDDSVRESLAALLEPLSIRIFTYSNAQDFLDSLETEAAPDCLITEVDLPGLGGLQLLEQLSKLGHHVPTIFLSRDGNVRTAVHAMRVGAVDFIEKPFINGTLLQNVKKIISARREPSTSK